jgi:heme exporter protein A
VRTVAGTAEREAPAAPGTATPILLRLAGVRVRLGRQLVLDGVDLEVGRGEIVAVFGPNGAGKTTLLRTAAGLVRPQSGRVLLPGGRAALGYVGHQTLLTDELTARENLTFYGRLFGLDKAAAAARAAAVLREEGLALFADDPVRSFSRGMQQRLAIGRAFLHAPSLVLLDEPWTGLDPEAAQRLAARLRELRAGGGSAVLVSHDLEGALAIADRYVLLAGGRVRAQGPAAPYRGRGAAFADLFREVVRQAGAERRRGGVAVPAPAGPPPDEPDAARSGPGWWRACAAVAGRDLRLEFRSRENLAAMGVFGLLVAVMLGFAFDPLGTDLRPVFAGALWLALLFAGMLGTGRSFARELANDALTGLALAPVEPSALFYGKCLANAAFLGLAMAALTPVFFVLLLVPAPGRAPALAAALALGGLGLVAVATFTAAIAAQTRAGEVVQPLLALPLLSPLLIGSVRLAQSGLGGAPALHGAGPWYGLLIAFDLVFWGLPALLFDALLELGA